MENHRETAVFCCALIGGIADIIAIFVSITSGKSAIMFIIIAFLLLLGAIIYLWSKLKERLSFIEFIEHLFNNTTHNFTLLPKICLALDKSKEKSNLCARDLLIKYTCDMSNVKLNGLKEDSVISYDDIVEYSFTVENKKIPEEFVCYLGNMYADDPVEISQKHGSQETFEIVPPPRYTDETRVASVVQRYSWQIKKDCVTHGKELPITFRMKYDGSGKPKEWCTFIFYPKQYARRIDNVTFEVDYICSKKVLQRVELFKVCKDNKVYKHIPISGVIMSENNAQISVHPDATQNEAYYLRVYWDLL